MSPLALFCSAGAALLAAAAAMIGPAPNPGDALARALGSAARSPLAQSTALRTETRLRRELTQRLDETERDPWRFSRVMRPARTWHRISMLPPRAGDPIGLLRFEVQRVERLTWRPEASDDRAPRAECVYRGRMQGPDGEILLAPAGAEEDESAYQPLGAVLSTREALARR